MNMSERLLGRLSPKTRTAYCLCVWEVVRQAACGRGGRRVDAHRRAVCGGGESSSSGNARHARPSPSLGQCWGIRTADAASVMDDGEALVAAVVGDSASTSPAASIENYCQGGRPYLRVHRQNFCQQRSTSWGIDTSPTWTRTPSASIRTGARYERGAL